MEILAVLSRLQGGGEIHGLSSSSPEVFPSVAEGGGSQGHVREQTCLGSVLIEPDWLS